MRWALGLCASAIACAWMPSIPAEAGGIGSNDHPKSHAVATSDRTPAGRHGTVRNDPPESATTQSGIGPRQDISIRLQYTSLWNGPQFTVTILGDRTGTLVARRPGANDDECCGRVAKRLLSAHDYDLLVRQIDSMGFSELHDRYPYFDGPSPIVSNMYSTMSITVDGPDGVHRVERMASVPCESDFQLEHSGANGQDAHDGTVRAVDVDPLAGAHPAPDSLCKLEGAIDRLTGAWTWFEETTEPSKKAH